MWLAILLACESHYALMSNSLSPNHSQDCFSLTKPAWILDFSFGSDSHKDWLHISIQELEGYFWHTANHYVLLLPSQLRCCLSYGGPY